MRKKLIGALAGFLVIMLVFTLLSRAADSMGIPRVSTAKPGKMVIAHSVSAQGKVVQNREQAVHTEANQLVKAIYVNDGQQVEKGDLLFELDMEELKEQILAAKQDLQIKKLQVGDSSSAAAVNAGQKSGDQGRAAQDYQDAVNEANNQVEAARKNLEAAKKALNAFGSGKDSSGGSDSVEKTLEDTGRQKQAAYQNAVKEREDIERQIEDEIQKVQNNAKKAAQTEAAETESGLAEGAGLTGASEKETQSALDKQLSETEIRNKYQPALDAAVKKEEETKKEWEEAQKALEQYQSSQAEQAASSAKASKAELKQRVEEAQQAYDQAVIASGNSVKSAARAVEDANEPQASDSSVQVGEIEIEQKELELKKLKELADKQGQIVSPVKGIVTKVSITTGDRTPDGTCILLADTSSGSKFIAQISTDQEEYIGRNDPVTLKPNGNGKKVEGLTVDGVRANEENKDLLDIIVQLPSDVLEIGTGAVMEAVKKSDPYNCCVPLSSLYVDGNQYYVLVTEEISTVLGTELTARRVNVNVLDKNTEYAALEEGGITTDQNVIVGSDRSLEADARVRLDES